MGIPDGFAVRTMPHTETIAFRVAGPNTFGSAESFAEVIRILGAQGATDLSLALDRAARSLVMGIAWQDGEWTEPTPVSANASEAVVRDGSGTA